MNEPRMTTTDDPPPSDREFLDERIYEYNVAATGITDGRLLSLSVRDEQDTLIAGLYGWTWGACLFIEFLWVDEAWRGTGYGTQLLQAAEAEGIARGCTLVALGTHDFQAPEFYRKHGYEIYGEIRDYPRGFAQYHLKKRLKRESD